MKLSNLKIRTQMMLGFAVILALTLLLDIIGILHANAMVGQARTLYNHPLQVRQAIDNFRADVLSIHLNMKDLAFSPSEDEIVETLARIDILEADALDQIDIFYARYLGPKSDVDRVRQEFIAWNAIRAETIRLLRAGETEEAVARTRYSGVGGSQALKVLDALSSIDTFCLYKANELIAASESMAEKLYAQNAATLVLILLLMLGIYTLLSRSIRQPLDEMSRAAREFTGGDHSARSAYTLKNEFGDLSQTFNELASEVQSSLVMGQRTARFSSVMASENEAPAFFRAILTELCAQTGSQIAAAYLLSADGRTYEHFDSIGLEGSARASFAAGTPEGEFGQALSARSVQHIRAAADGSRNSFQTVVGGVFTPREIITIPVLAGRQVAAVVSLATIGSYDEQARNFIDETWDLLNARVTGILTFRQVQALAKSLGLQNRELDSQKMELMAQAAVLDQQNRELESQKAQLSEANRMKTSFISNMSHELRTPLNSVIALSGVLGRRLAGQVPEEVYSYLEVIERNGKQLLALINDILDLSRIEAGREEVEIRKFNINELLAEVASTLQPLADQKEIGLVFQPAAKPITVTSDYAKCRHILQNLVGNAVKFTEKGQVSLKAIRAGGMLQVSVSDTGIGIPESEIPHIFDEFRQADSSTSRAYDGSGLGLAIARRYAEMLGGSISVASRESEGSTFTLSLPLRARKQPAIKADRKGEVPGRPKPSTTALAPSERAGRTLLLVEDSEPAVIQISDILEEAGYQLLIARDGRQALEVLASTRPDAVILDLMMPEMDGFAVLRSMREVEATARIPVLILTGRYVSLDEQTFLRHNHIHQLVQKGALNRAELLAVVDGMLALPPENAVKAPPTRRAPADKLNVLVVEDNPDNMLSVRALLAGEEFNVIEAVDGEQGFALARSHRPDLVLMDIALPKMDGIQALQAIRRDPGLQHVRVVALTASAMTTDREKVLAYGFDGYIPKPIDHEVFMRTIRQVIYGTH